MRLIQKRSFSFVAVALMAVVAGAFSLSDTSRLRDKPPGTAMGGFGTTVELRPADTTSQLFHMRKMTSGLPARIGGHPGHVDGFACRAADGGCDIQETATAMKRIAEKNGIIGDIAYQTNFLALNAAAEVAHFGEHGKDFAFSPGRRRRYCRLCALLIPIPHNTGRHSPSTKHPQQQAQMAGFGRRRES